jgi:hypothetical protein
VPFSEISSICILPFVLHTHTKQQVKYNSNKSPTRCKNFYSLLSWRLFTAQHVSGVLTPIIRSSTTAVAASCFTFGAWW